MIEVILTAVIFFIVFRIAFLLFFKTKSNCLKANARTLIVIGSGGHTLEMIKQVKTLNPKLYEPRMYVMADTDKSSEHKVKELEFELQSTSRTEYNIAKIPRSRVVNQSYVSSIFTTLKSTLHCIPLVTAFKPDLVLCNGPGTCIPICIISFFLNVLMFFNTRIIFVESICRVKTLSLSGKILLHIADQVIVQWPSLQEKYPKTLYLGRLV